MKTKTSRFWGMIGNAALGVVIMTGLLLPVIQPLLAGCLPRYDGVFHLYRIAQLDHAIRNGVLYPRWLTDLGFGFGFPLFNYYTPLGYYLALPFHTLGLGFESTLLAGFILAHAILVLGTGLWTQDIFGSRAGLGAALVIAYAPYPLVNLLHRGAYAEVWGLAWLSMALWAYRRLVVRRDRISYIMATLFHAALMLSHNVIALLGAPLLAAYALLLIWKHKRRGKDIVRLLLVPSLALGITAFFWIPALFEQDYVQIHQLKIYDFREHFLSVSELFSGPRPTDAADANPDLVYGVGWIAPLLAVAGWVPWRHQKAREAAVEHLLLTLATIGLLMMTLSLTLPVWERIPLLSFLQFPSRFLGPASLLLAALAGYGASRLPGPHWLWPPAVLLLTVGFALPWLFPLCSVPQPALTPPNLIRIEQDTGGVGTTVAGDYLPRWVAVRPTGDELLPYYDAAAPGYIIDRLDHSSLPDGVNVRSANYGLQEARLKLESDVAFDARFNWYYFPGWRATLDGLTLAVRPDGPQGLLSMTLPPGAHTLRVWFGDTPLRRAATGLSGLSLAIFVAFAFWTPARPVSQPNKEDPHPITRKTLFVCLGVGLIALIAKVAYLDQANTFLHTRRFDGQQLQGVDVPLDVRFGEEMRLLGFDRDGATLSSDRPLPFTLYWTTLPPVETDYSIAVHLVDTQGRLYGQEDHQHPGNYPTRRLPPGEFIRDSYQLTAFAGTPPGSYTVLAGLYTADGGQHQDAWQADGRWLGVWVSLGDVTVTLPDTAPAVEDLPIAERQQTDMGTTGVRFLGFTAADRIANVGQGIPLTLFWQSTAAPARDFHARLQLVDERGRVVAFTTLPPGSNSHPTSLWLPGEVIRDGRTFVIPAAHGDNTTRPIETGRYTLTLALVDAMEQPVSASIALFPIDITAPKRTFTIPDMDQTVALHLGDVATLAGYTLASATIPRGGTLSLDIVWRAESATQTSYTVFVHLLDAAGNIVAQHDQPPVGGARPTTSWLAGEVLQETISLSLPAEIPPGIYRLDAGMYDPATYGRLPVSGADGAPQGDAILLTEIHVIGAEE
ncbi:MAG: hypothetical protein JXB35_08965 [Anaerolineae bacterium]|nr:hypothetical protein [Anaerolineae bacterium]